jgi:hypothetical protein
MLEPLKRPLRPLALRLMGALRRHPVGRNAARHARRHLPGPYAWLIRRYQVYSLSAMTPPRLAPAPRIEAPRVVGLSPEAQLVARQLALAAQQARAGSMAA